MFLRRINTIAIVKIWHEAVFETIWNCRENENNVYKECILTLFEMILNIVSKARILIVF